MSDDAEEVSALNALLPSLLSSAFGADLSALLQWLLMPPPASMRLHLSAHLRPFLRKNPFFGRNPTVS